VILGIVVPSVLLCWDLEELCHLKLAIQVSHLNSQDEKEEVVGDVTVEDSSIKNVFWIRVGVVGVLKVAASPLELE